MTEEDFKTTVLYRNLFKVLGNDLDFPVIIQNCLVVLKGRSSSRYGCSAVGSSACADVDNAFVWDRTPQGHEYWQRIHSRYIDLVS